MIVWCVFIVICLAAWAMLIRIIQPIQVAKAISAGWRQQSRQRITHFDVWRWQFRNRWYKKQAELDLQEFIRQPSKTSNRT